MSLLFVFFITFLSVQSAPIEPEKNEVTPHQQQAYDISQFDEVHDQRQNGTENWRVNLNKIMLVWVPPKDLLTAAMILSPDLLESDLSDFDDFLKPEKPEDAVVIKPETTTKKVEGSTQPNTQDASSSIAPLAAPAAARRRRIPGFLRPFVRRQHTSL